MALQACGVSIFRLLRPIALLAVLASAATAYEMIVALPDANQTFREITFNIIASGAESDVKPRVFFTSFPNRVLYVRDMPAGGGWRDVFLADATQPDQTTVYRRQAGPAGRSTARSRRWSWCSRTARSHTTSRDQPDDYDGSAFESHSCSTWTPRPCSRARRSSRATTR